MASRVSLWGLVLLGGAFSSGQSVSSPSSISFKVIVNQANNVESLSKAEVSRLFLKKTLRWEAGGRVEPIDQSAASSVRVSFSSEVHGRSVDAVRAYWRKLLFKGKIAPPPTRATDSAILDFVANKANAIGYVSGDAAIGAGTRVLTILE
ncbi:MAG: phosphate ABC transporter substrate-binding protein [Acidobacteria bacterium]|nr:MAG: phosphate ABC transporter substrate-binding protein [Acidobacteriota bacterium]